MTDFGQRKIDVLCLPSTAHPPPGRFDVQYRDFFRFKIHPRTIFQPPAIQLVDCPLDRPGDERRIEKNDIEGFWSMLAQPSKRVTFDNADTVRFEFRGVSPQMVGNQRVAVEERRRAGAPRYGFETQHAGTGKRSRQRAPEI